jgi:quinol monooxygenase YgiN
VRSDEPGNKLCTLYKLPDANGYILLQRYDDEAALETHRATPHFDELRRML